MFKISSLSAALVFAADSLSSGSAVAKEILLGASVQLTAVQHQCDGLQLAPRAGQEQECRRGAGG